MKLTKSEFLANGNLTLHVKDGKPCPTMEGAEEIIVKDGEPIPDLFIPNFLRYNRNFIRNLEYKDSIPVLNEKQEKKYGVKFERSRPEMKIQKEEWTQEKLTEKLNKLKAKKFKEWAEKKFGEQLDRRKSAKAIIVEILRMQEEGRRK